MTSCSARRSSSTRRCSPRSTRSSGRPRSSRTPSSRSRMRANWWGLAEREAASALRPHQQERRDQRHPGLGATTTTARRTSSPRSSSSVYRLHPLLPEELEVRALEDDSLLDVDGVPGDHPAQRPARARRRRKGVGPLVLVRRPASRCRPAAQLPALDAGPHTARRHAPRPRRARHHARPRARGAALQRVPASAAPHARRRPSTSSRTTRSGPKSSGDVRRRRREGRSAGRHACRDAAARDSASATRRSACSSSWRAGDSRATASSPTATRRSTTRKTGLQWIADNTCEAVLLRHFPELGKALDGVANAFAPWNVSTSRTTPAAAATAAGQHE